MGICKRLQIFPEIKVTLRSPTHISVTAQGRPLLLKLPLSPNGKQISICRRAMSLVTPSDHTYRIFLAEHRIRLVKYGGQWTIVLDLPSNEWLAKPIALRNSSWLVGASVLAGLVGVSALALTAHDKSQALQREIDRAKISQTQLEERREAAAKLSETIEMLRQELSDQKREKGEEVLNVTEKSETIVRLTKQVETVNHQLLEIANELNLAKAKIKKLSDKKKSQVRVTAAPLTKSQVAEFHEGMERLKVRIADATEMLEVSPVSENTEELKISLEKATEFYSSALKNGPFDARSDVELLLSTLFKKMGDVVGAVQVFVRMRSTPSVLTKKFWSTADKDITGCYNKPSPDSSSHTISINQQSFSDMPAYDPINFPDNESVWSKRIANQPASIRDTVSKVLDGQSVVVLAYGASGAGKTFLTLNREDGMIEQSIGLLKEKNITFEFVIFEQCFRQLAQDSDKKWKIGSKIILLYGELPAELSDIKTLDITKNNTTKGEIIKATSTDPKGTIMKLQGLMDVLDGVQMRRESYNRIKPTPNNDKSSRSHLYIMIKCADTEHNALGTLTFIDMAGVESPTDIYRDMALLNEDLMKQGLSDWHAKKIDGKPTKFTNMASGLTGKDVKLQLEEILRHPRSYLTEVGFKSYIISKAIQDEVNNDTQFESRNYNSVFFKQTLEKFKSKKLPPKFAADLIREGIFINESINEMREFLLGKRGVRMLRVIQTDLQSSTAEKFFNNKAESEKYTQTTQILNYLDKATMSKPVKWVVLIAVRPELEYCAQTATSLCFGRSISFASSSSESIEAVLSSCTKNTKNANDTFQPTQPGDEQTTELFTRGRRTKKIIIASSSRD